MVIFVQPIKSNLTQTASELTSSGYILTDLTKMDFPLGKRSSTSNSSLVFPVNTCGAGEESSV